MDANDRRQPQKLPVTEEVGSEGGSYADPTLHVATFGTDSAAERQESADQSVAGEAIRSSEIASGGIGTAPDPASGAVRYPTEPPASARRTGEARGKRWKAGAAGAAIGAAGALLFWNTFKGRKVR